MGKHNTSEMAADLELDRLANTGLSGRLKELTKANKSLSQRVDDQDLEILKLKAEIKHLRKMA